MKATAYYTDGTPAALGDRVALRGNILARLICIEDNRDHWIFTCLTEEHGTYVLIDGDLGRVTFLSRRNAPQGAVA